jgi:prepilin-type N-terminal cleavage/methylation domain-containing protein
MKKGFTLVELLGVIAILGIIALIATPAINRSLIQGKEELYQTQIKQIIKGCKSYYAEHLSEMPTNLNQKVCKTLDVLKSSGYLPLDIKNPKTGADFPGTTNVCITKTGENEFTYSVN